MTDADLTTPPVDEGSLAHSGFVAVIGKPNVGKSTLMNRILGEKIAIVSPKPQTTRLRQFGIYTQADVQVVFVDTPGIHQPRHKLGQFMVDVALEALRDADAILFVVDLSEVPDEEDQRVADLLREAQTNVPVVLALNKIDRLSPEQIAPRVEAYRALAPHADWATLSAVKGSGVDDVLKRVIDKLPAGPQYYPEDQLSDTAMRDIVAEIIREKVLLNTEQEVPHAVAVEVEEFKERSASLTYIGATIYVERDSQKGILIGKGGAMLKKISSEARADAEALVGTKVFLELWVKVLKNWRRDDALLQRLGYRIGK
ncbi:MAG: GTPase Era [Anaerolineae bacterium]|nr:GTPase Era [Anaerolineae bacterium]